MNPAPSGRPNGYVSPEMRSSSPSRYSIAAGTTPDASTRSIAPIPVSASGYSPTTGSSSSGAGCQPQPGGGDQPERPLRADEQALQVVGGHVLAQRPAERDDLPGRHDRLDARHPVPRHAVLEGVRPAGVAGDVAADLRDLRRPGVRRERAARSRAPTAGCHRWSRRPRRASARAAGRTAGCDSDARSRSRRRPRRGSRRRPGRCPRRGRSAARRARSTSAARQRPRRSSRA